MSLDTQAPRTAFVLAQNQEQRDPLAEAGSAVSRALPSPEQPEGREPDAATPEWRDVPKDEVDDFWSEFVSSEMPETDQLRKLIDEMSQARRFDHVIALIEATIIEGVAEPWMYEILALAMEIEGRPKEQIERVLLSSVDFIASDVPAMIYLAAYLSRFGRDEQALTLYRQASDIEPAHAEPYVMGLKVAERLKDDKAVIWAATGVLRYDWGADYADRHQQALSAIAEVDQRLKTAGRDEERQRLKQAVAEARVRDLEFHVRWSGKGNIDLLVDEPPGSQCSLDNRRTPAGGILAQDGNGGPPEDSRALYVNPLAISGEYRFRVRYMWGNIVGKRCQVTLIRHAGSPSEVRQSWVIPIDTSDRILRVNVPNGRREELSAVAPPLPKLELEPAIRDKAALRRAFAQAGNSVLAQQIGGGQTGFVGGGVPGGNAIGFQPVVTTLSEGVQLSALALVSGDRRYVRLTLAPAFTSITDVFTFSFFSGGGQ